MIIHDDALNAAQHVKDNSVDLLIYDPPYGIGNRKLTHKSKKWSKTQEDWDSFNSVDEQYQFYMDSLAVFIPLMKKNGNIFIFGSFHNIYLIGQLLQQHFDLNIVNSIVWYKTNAMFNITKRSLIESTEHLIWCSLSKKYYFNYEAAYAISDKQLRNVWTSTSTPRQERLAHPHQKPTWLIKRIIDIACPQGGLVLDPMVGSGTTAVICQHMGIEFVGIEKNIKYFQLAQNRLKRDFDPF